MRVRFLLVAMVLGALALSAHAYRLEYKDTAGTERQYKMAFNIDGKTEMMGMSIPMKGTMTMEAIERVLSAAQDAADISMETKAGQMTMVVAVPGMGEEGQGQTINQPLPGYTMTFTRTRLGKVSNIKYSGDMAQMMGNQFSMMNNQLQNLGQGFEFPDRDLKIGDTWSGKQEIELAPDNKLAIAMNYKLTGTKVVNGVTYLVVTCDISANIPKLVINPPAQQGDQQNAPAMTPMTMGIVLKGQSATLFNEAAGEYLETAMKMTTAVTMSGMAGADQPMVMNMNMNGKITKVN